MAGKWGKYISMILLVLLLVCPVQVAAVESVPLGEEGGLEEVPDGWIEIIYMGDEWKRITIPAGCAIADLWEPETVHGSKFLYWTTNIWDAVEDRVVVTSETVFYEDETLHAVTEDTSPEAEDFSRFPSGDYVPLRDPDETTEESDCYVIRFHDCNGDYAEDWDLEFKKNKKLGDGVEVIESIEPWYPEYEFLGWYTAEDGGDKVEFTKDTVITGDMDVYAHWKRVVNYYVSYMKNYGKDEQRITKAGFEHPKLGYLPDIGRRGYKFLGWYTKPKGGRRVKMGDKLTAKDVTIYAHWEKIKVSRVSINRLFGKEKAVMVKYKKQKGVKGYQMQVSTSKRFEKKKTVTKTYSNNKIFTRTVKKLKKGTTYYVRIRAFKKDSTGAKVYGKWSKVKKIQTKK